jgi:hypothetical protein
MSNQRARLSKAKAHLSEDSLTLPYPKVNLMESFKVMGEQLAVPEVLVMTEFSRVAPQVTIDGLPLSFIEPSRTPIPLTFTQPGEAAFLKTLHPAFNRSRILPESIANVITAEAMCYQEDPMQTVIITGFLRPQNLLLHCNSHDLLIRDLQFAHVHVLLPKTMAGDYNESNRIMRHYLRRHV